MFTKIMALALFGVGVATANASAMQTTLWVDKDKPGDDVNGEGTQSEPYLTISKALAVVNGGSGAYIIKIVDGDYTQAHEEVAPVTGAGYPINITHSDGITIVGVDADGNPPELAEYPRIGGDVGEDATALFSLLLEGEEADDMESLEISKLHFLGEDEVDSDAPIAIDIQAYDGRTIEDFVIQNNTFERPNFNGTGTPRATIHIQVRDATIHSRGPGLVSGNTIYCSDRGGIEVIAGAAEDEAAKTNFAVDRNVFKVSVGDAAEFALRWIGEDLGASGGATVAGYFGLPSITGNTVLGRGSIGTGIAVICPEHTSYGANKAIDENVVTGCEGNAVELSVDGWDAGTIPEITTTFVRNRLINNGGSGLVLRWDPDADTDGAGYLVLSSEGNLFADNDGYGIEMHGYGDSSAGAVGFHNETIVNNELGAEGYFVPLLADDWGPNGSPSHVNCITQLNEEPSGVESQVYIYPFDAGVLAELLDNVSYSNWFGIAFSNGNIDEDPDFVNAALGNYHLLTGSPCIDSGFNDGSGEAIDIDEQDRIQDGDCAGDPAAVVDMGHDEFPEPHCE